MASEKDHLAVVARVDSLWEADELRTLLQAYDIRVFIPDEVTLNTLSHMTLAINPKGVRVVVNRGDLARARQILAETDEPRPSPSGPDVSDDALHEWEPVEGFDEPDARPALGSSDDCAERALRSATFAWLFSPVAALGVYYFVRAIRTARRTPPSDLRRFQRNLRGAVLIGLPPLGVLVLLAGLLIYAVAELLAQ